MVKGLLSRLLHSLFFPFDACNRALTPAHAPLVYLLTTYLLSSLLSFFSLTTRVGLCNMSEWFDCISPFTSILIQTIDNRSLSRSLQMLSNHFLGGPKGSWPFASKFKIFLGDFSSSRRWRLPNQQKRLYLTKSSILEIPIRVLRHRYFFA